ncbi:hypothetical protein, partial [Pseudomonas floridensis]|uniref:hypothetical protein n=1 Tax=Pseudomonas floridensis TaxID=1958950 RepID=UPI0039E741DF
MMVSAPRTPHSKQLTEARCCAPDFFLELASHDATRHQSRKSRMRSINPTCQTIGQRFTVAFLASSSMAAELRSLLQTKRAAAAQVR